MRTVIVLLGLAALVSPLIATAQETRTHDVLLHDWLHIAPETMLANQGDTLALRVKNVDGQSSPHDLVFEGYDVRTPMLSPGQSVDISFRADEAGTFEYWCSVPGHKEGGMVGTLVVNAPSGGGGAGGAPPADDGGATTPGAAAALVLVAVAGAALVLRIGRGR